jgi:hypothetical protein
LWIGLAYGLLIERDSDFDSLPSSVPARITQVLRLCLRKDPRHRVGDIRDVRLALEGAFETAALHATAPTSTPRSAWSRALPWAVAAGLAGALTFVVALWAPWRMPAVDQPLMELEISPPEGTSFGRVGTSSPAAVSPDGLQVVLKARAKDGDTHAVAASSLVKLSTNPSRYRECPGPFLVAGRPVGVLRGGRSKDLVGRQDSVLQFSETPTKRVSLAQLE